MLPVLYSSFCIRAVIHLHINVASTMNQQIGSAISIRYMHFTMTYIGKKLTPAVPDDQSLFQLQKVESVANTKGYHSTQNL